MATYLADRVVVYSGQPSVAAHAGAYVTHYVNITTKLTSSIDRNRFSPE